MRLCNSLSTIHLNAILFGETPARFIWSFALTHGFSDISILSWQWCAFCHTSLDSVPFGSSYTNKHRDFDTTSRCSFYVQKSRNTNIFKAFRNNVLPGRDYSCRVFLLYYG